MCVVVYFILSTLSVFGAGVYYGLVDRSHALAIQPASQEL